MKRSVQLKAFLLITGTVFFGCSETAQQHDVKQLREKHAVFLENSPFKRTLSLSEEARKTFGIPPNKYYERQWELTMNPALGYPEPYKAAALQKTLKNPKTQLAYRVPGDAADNQWTERGPNNVGGRTHVVFFDPNDPTNSRVFAGAISGGLWVTDDITTNGGWTQVSGVPGNLNVSCYTIDPNNPDIWYIGTGEQYTGGAVVGNGIYRTIDGGMTWTHSPIQVAGGDSFVFDPTDTFFAGAYYINDIIAWDNAGTTEIFVGIGAHVYADASSPANWLGLQSAGLYRSVNNGDTWSRIEPATMAFEYFGETYYHIPNDLEIAADNTLWMATIDTPGLGGASGQIYSSVDGVNWAEAYQVPDGRRIEIEPSATDAGRIYVLAQTFGIPVMVVTDDAFATAPTAITTPDDPDTSIPSNDFTRGQSFYDLVVEADPINDNIVYVGGINLHRSTDSGASWTTLSHWRINDNPRAGSLVHADQHALTFRPGDSDQAILGHDGGVSFADDLSATGNDLTAIYDVDDGYNVTQFYHMGAAPTAFAVNSFFGGTQDNGTQHFFDANPAGTDNGSDLNVGGDGAYSFYDQVATDYLVTNYLYNNYIALFDFSVGAWRIIASNVNEEGDFINPQALDSNMDILYSNGATGFVFQLFRYEGLTNLAEGVEAVRTVLTNPLLNAPATALEVSPYTPTQTNLIVGLENGRVLRITNADQANPALSVWTELTGPLFVGSISDVQFGQTEDDVFVTFHNYGVVSIWYTNDGGISWQNKEGNLPDIPVKCILQNPLNPEEVIVGTELGVWRTENFSAASPDWLQSYNGMSDVKVTDLQLRDDNMAFASTFGRGIFSGQFTAPSLSVNDEELPADQVKIYPTVSDGALNISSTIDFGETRVNIYNLKGQKVYATEVFISENTIGTLQLYTLSSGIYLMNFNNGSQKFTSKFVIK